MAASNVAPGVEVRSRPASRPAVGPPVRAPGPPASLFVGTSPALRDKRLFRLETARAPRTGGLRILLDRWKILRPATRGAVGVQGWQKCWAGAALWTAGRRRASPAVHLSSRVADEAAPSLRRSVAEVAHLAYSVKLHGPRTAAEFIVFIDMGHVFHICVLTALDDLVEHSKPKISVNFRTIALKHMLPM